MMRILMLSPALCVLFACSIEHGVKQTGEAIEKGAENIVEGVKQTPRALGDVADKIDRAINEPDESAGESPNESQ